MKKVVSYLVVLGSTVAVLPIGFAHEGHEAKHAPLDFAIVHVDKVSRLMPVRVREFDTGAAHLGKGKTRSQAEEMETVAPGRLSQELLSGLEANGFKDIAVVKEGEELPEACLVIEGNFTVLNPGSSTKRVLWGFGAGKTQVCIRGSVLDADGESLAEFDHCRMGLGWSSAQSQMSGDTEHMGDQIARFLAAWADGKYAQ
jgi:hypothetical protein